jgi:amidophosphoribosyltransferase
MKGRPMGPEVEREMAQNLGADTLRYLPVDAISRAVGFPQHQLCQACVTGKYPTDYGQFLFEQDLADVGKGCERRSYEVQQIMSFGQ